MKDVKSYLKIKRQGAEYRPVCERVEDFRHVAVPRDDEVSRDQASRCMNCGTPFCHWGCPLGNYIPEWNDLMFRGQWQKAFDLLDATNNMPEITGRLCPALCESACVLGINDEPVTVRENELAIIEYAFSKGFVLPRKAAGQTGKKVAVIGSGPAGLAAAAQLARAGHSVVVFEQDRKAGGILRYGIPDFKLEKSIIDRRLTVWEKQGIEFVTATAVGRDYAVEKIIKEFDAVCLSGGAQEPRDLNIEGRDLRGICFAMDFLRQANKKESGESFSGEPIDARDKKVVVIGGGDTGADCVGVCHRQHAACVTQIEVMPEPPQCRTEAYPWPKYPLVLKTSSSHQEGGVRRWSVRTEKFTGEKGHVKKLSCVQVEFVPVKGNACPQMRDVPGSRFEIDADLVILAVGFVHPRHQGMVNDLSLGLDGRGNVATGPDYHTSRQGVFAAGDMRRGQSLIVHAVAEGRRCAHHMDAWLTGKKSVLPEL